MMDRKRFDFLRNRLTDGIPSEMRKLTNEESSLQKEILALAVADFEKLADAYDGKPIRAKLLSVNREAWRLLLQPSKWAFTLVDVESLRKHNRDAALRIASAISKRDSALEVGSIIEISPDGRIVQTRTHSTIPD